MRLCLLLALALLTNSDLAKGNSESTLDTLSDSNRHSITVDNTSFLVFEHIDNDRLLNTEGEELKWSQAKYYVLPPFRLSSLNSSAPVKLLESPSGIKLINFSIRPVSYDQSKISDSLASRQVNVFAQPHNILPFPIQELFVSIPLIDEQFQTTLSGSISTNREIDVLIPTESDDAEFIVDGLNSGDFEPKALATFLLSTTQRNNYTVNWESIRKDEVFRDYSGPSGPEFVTANQAASLASMLSHSLRESIWIESSDDSRKEALAWIMDGLKSSMSTHLPIDNSTWDLLLPADVARMQDMNDLVTKLATDARSLDDQQWCDEYRNYWEGKDEYIAKGSGKAKVILPPFFGEGGGGGSERSTWSEISENESSNCGKDLVSDSFTYELEGEKWIPKSIVVYENISKGGETAARTTSDSFTFSQTKKSIDLEIVR